MLFINMGVTRFATLAVLLVLACFAPGATAKNEVPNKSKTSRFGRSPKVFAYDARSVLLELNDFYDDVSMSHHDTPPIKKPIAPSSNHGSTPVRKPSPAPDQGPAQVPSQPDVPAPNHSPTNGSPVPGATARPHQKPSSQPHSPANQPMSLPSSGTPFKPNASPIAGESPSEGKAPSSLQPVSVPSNGTPSNPNASPSDGIAPYPSGSTAPSSVPPVPLPSIGTPSNPNATPSDGNAPHFSGSTAPSAVPPVPLPSNGSPSNPNASPIAESAPHSSVSSSPSPVKSPIGSTGPPNLVDPSIQQPALAPPSTIPPSFLAPSAGQSPSSSDLCLTTNGAFGSLEGELLIVPFGYQLETVPLQSDYLIQNVLPALESAFNDYLLPILFVEECSIGRRLATPRRLAIVGISASPDDLPIAVVACSNLVEASNECSVMMGELSIYLEDRSLADDDNVRAALKKGMDAGAFDDTEEHIVRVSYVDLSIIDTSFSKGSKPLESSSSGGSGVNAVLVVGVMAAAASTVLIGAAVAYRRRKNQHHGLIAVGSGPASPDGVGCVTVEDSTYTQDKQDGTEGADVDLRSETSVYLDDGAFKPGTLNTSSLDDLNHSDIKSPTDESIYFDNESNSIKEMPTPKAEPASAEGDTCDPDCQMWSTVCC